MLITPKTNQTNRYCGFEKDGKIVTCEKIYYFIIIQRGIYELCEYLTLLQSLSKRHLGIFQHKRNKVVFRSPKKL